MGSAPHSSQKKDPALPRPGGSRQRCRNYSAEREATFGRPRKSPSETEDEVHSLHQVMLDGVAGQFGVSLQTHLLEDALAVGADGFDAQGILLGDFPNGFAGGD